MFRRSPAQLPDPPLPEPTDWLGLVRPAALFDFVVTAAVAAAVVFVLARFAASTAEIGRQAETIPTSTPMPTATPRPVYHIGDKAAAGDLVLTVSTVTRQRDVELPGTEGRLAARGEWVALDVVLRASADRPMQLRSEDFELRTPTGEVYEVDVGATQLVNQALGNRGYRAPGEMLPKNAPVSVRLFFDVPEVKRDLRLVVWPGTTVDLSK